MLLTTTHPTGKQIILIDKRQLPGEPFPEPLEEKFAEALAQKKRILIIGTKSSFASGIVCKDCGTIPHCTHCDLPIARHQDMQKQLFGLCHLCKTYYPRKGACEHCHGHSFDHFGKGLQHLQGWIAERYHTDSLIVDRSVANSVKKLEKLLPTIAQHQLILSTGLLTQPPAGIAFDLVIVTHADLGLQSPDLGASRSNFCFLSEICEKYTAPEIRMCSYKPDHPSIQHAIRGDLPGMQAYEDAHRQRFHYPPYTDLCVLLYKHEVENRLYTTVNKLYQELLFLKASYGKDDLEVYATPPLIYKAFGKFRYHIALKGTDLHAFMDIAYSKLKIPSRGFKVDWDPQNLI